MAGAPKTFSELFDFYHNSVKIYYGVVQSENVLPAEVLFELNAALDHLSRFYIYKEPERDVVSKAYSHMKRACLDIFKITLRETLDQYQELLKVDISLIDNGDFEKKLKMLANTIKIGAREARRLEGRPTSSASAELTVPAFDRWLPVYEDCLALQQDYYLHDSIDWAKSKSRGLTWRALIGTSLVSVVLGFLFSKIWAWLLVLGAG